MGIIEMLVQDVERQMERKRNKQLQDILKVINEAKKQGLPYCYYATESLIAGFKLMDLGYELELSEKSTDKIRIIKISWEV